MNANNKNEVQKSPKIIKELPIIIPKIAKKEDLLKIFSE
jgi:hypothetical protein